MRNGGRVLVLDGDMASSLSIVRSLASIVSNVEAGAHTLKSYAFRSKHCDVSWLYPDPLACPESFILWLVSHLNQHQYDLIIPVTERTLNLIHEARDKFSRFPIAMAKEEALTSVLDKSATFILANELGLRVPTHYSITNISDLDTVSGKLSFPVVVKPGRSMGKAMDHRSQLKVEYAFCAVELNGLCKSALKYGEVILQEYVNGVGVGVEVLADNGDILFAFQHERVHEVPLTGGGSSLRKSTPLDPGLYEQTSSLIHELRWDGVAMVEFKVDRHSGVAYLMEVNGRFWGSLPLAEAAGANFPAMLYRYWVNGETSFSQVYTPDVHGRNLSSDILWHELVLRKAVPQRLNVLPQKGDILHSLRLVFSRRHQLDVQRLSDPMPGLQDIAEIVSSYAARFFSVLSQRKSLNWQFKRWHSGEVDAVLAKANRIVFVCYGNINRSAIAELLFENQLLSNSDITHASFGFHQEKGRGIDPIMGEIAQADGISGQSFKSSELCEHDVAQADLIFVMEQRHFDEIVKYQPWARAYTFLLGGADSSTGIDIEISDPYGKPKQDYILCYNRVKSCIDTIASKMDL